MRWSQQTPIKKMKNFLEMKEMKQKELKFVMKIIQLNIVRKSIIPNKLNRIFHT